MVYTLLQNWPLQHFIKKCCYLVFFSTICDAYFTSVVTGYEFLFLKMQKKKNPFRPNLTESCCGRQFSNGRWLSATLPSKRLDTPNGVIRAVLAEKVVQVKFLKHGTLTTLSQQALQVKLHPMLAEKALHAQKTPKTVPKILISIFAPSSFLYSCKYSSEHFQLHATR